MGSILNSIVPKAGGSGMGGQGPRGDAAHGPGYYAMHPNQSPPQNPHPGGFGAMGQGPSPGNPFGVDQGTMNTMNQFGQRLDREGFNPFSTMNGTQGQGNAFNPLASLFGGQQGGGGFNPLQGLFGGGQQQGQQGGFNPFSFLGGL